MQDKAEAAGNLAAKGSAYAASAGLTVFGGLSAQEWAALFGIVLAFATFAVNWYYQHRRTQIAVESLDLRREKLGANTTEETEDDHRIT